MKQRPLKHFEQRADPTKLATLRQLAHAREQVKWHYQEKTIEEWIQEVAFKCLDDSDWHWADLSAFEEAGVGAIPALIEALRHKDWRMRLGAARLLDFFGPDALTAIPDLLKTTQIEPKARVRRQTLAALNSIERISISALPQLLRLLRDQDPEAAGQAARLVAQLGPAAEGALPLLVKGLDHPSLSCRSGFAYALGAIGLAHANVIEALAKHFQADDENISALTRALAQLAPGRLSELLLDLQRSLAASFLVIPRRFEDSLFALAHLGREASPLFPTIFELYKHVHPLAVGSDSSKYVAAEGILLSILSQLGHQADKALPFLMEQALKERHRKDYVKDLAVRRHYNQLPTYRALRSILIDSSLEEGRQQRSLPGSMWLQLKTRLRDAGLSRRQQHILASLERRTLEEHDLLRARVELRDLSPEHLRLAADLGHLPAMRALQQKLPRELDGLSTSAWKQWSQSLGSYEPEARARIGHALGRATLHIWEYHYLEDYPPLKAVLALENWIYAPGTVSQKYVENQGSFGLGQGGVRTSYCAARLTMGITGLIQARSLEHVLSYAVDAWRHVPGFDIPPQSIAPMHRKHAIVHIRQTIREMLIPWLLEGRDPVRDALTPLAELAPDVFFLR